MTKETVKTAEATVYEVGFHIVPAVSPEKLPEKVDAIKAILGQSGATIISEEFPKLRNLAYMLMKIIGPTRHKYDTAYFGWIKYEMSPDFATDVKKALDTDEKILRYLIVKTVRENTLYGTKILPEGERETVKTDDIKEVKRPKEMPITSAEELDKSIDKLVI
ncbi:MAG TPA: 30S ribosomal protein S6 [Candidatus Paceibacterota bacterium]